MAVQNPHIFYTDDDEDDQELFRGALNELDESLLLTSAYDGDDLLNRLKSPPPVPRIIFLDLNMPRRDGYEVLQKMRCDENLKNYPVIIFSTTSDSAAVAKTREMGASLFIPKPRSYSAMKQAIKACITIDWQDYNADAQGFLRHFG